MPKNALQHLDRAAVSSCSSGHGMPEAVQRNGRQIGSSQGGLVLLAQFFGIRITHPARNGANANARQLGGDRRRDWQHTAGSLAFEACNLVSLGCADALALDVQRVALEVLPHQAQGLPSAQAAGGHEQQQRERGLRSGGGNVAGELFKTQHHGALCRVLGLDAAGQR